MTSSPGPTPDASSARWSAVVPFDVLMAWPTPNSDARSASASSTDAPRDEIQPLSNAAMRRSRSVLLIDGLEIGIIELARMVSAGGRMGSPRRRPPTQISGGSQRMSQTTF